ncbi:MAG: methylglyoxal synthase [Burkholderiaceae bacterium]
MKTIALIAHDRKKTKLAEWVVHWAQLLSQHRLIATQTTGGVLTDKVSGLTLRKTKSGPLGGDQQIGAMIAQEEIDLLIFFTDPLSPHPHDVDVKALTRLATVYDVPMACSPATANLIMRSGYLSIGNADPISLSGSG